MMNSPEADLLHRCRLGDPQAIDLLVERYQSSVFRLALAILEDPAEAEQVAQDSFVAAFNGPGTLQGKTPFKTSLFAIAVNRCRGRLRQRRRQERLSKLLNPLFRASAPPQTRREDRVSRGEGRGEIRKPVNALDEQRRLALILRYYQDLPVGEIARVLGVSERSVHTWLRAAHQELTALLDF
jgi:RNA polymerase sigma-70 factor (ECF subfamily)